MPMTHNYNDFSFTNSDREERVAAVTRLNDCIRDVRIWLTRNMLKWNEEKTEVILFTSKHGLKSLSNITVTVEEQQQLLQSFSVRDLGVIYDQHLNMSQHVHAVCRTGYYQHKKYLENPTVSRPRFNKDTFTCLGNTTIRLQ